MFSCRVIVKDIVIQQDIYYKNHVILKYTIKYPQFISVCFIEFLEKLNALYRTKAMMYKKTNIMNLYQMAIAEYEYSVANNFPIIQYEAFLVYQITYNQNCALSLYYDESIYTGGAHDITTRSSDNWDLLRGKEIYLKDVIVKQNNLKEYIADIIIRQIEQKIQENTGFFFEDYEKLVKENINLNNFYLTEEGVVIYFQEYDIAPYSSGFPTFLIPYSSGIAIAPKCR